MNNAIGMPQGGGGGGGGFNSLPSMSIIGGSNSNSALQNNIQWSM